MSAMDGVIDAKTLVKHAYKMGQKAIGVVDHNCCQAFPDLFHAVGDINKGKEEKDKFKVLYFLLPSLLYLESFPIYEPYKPNLYKIHHKQLYH